MKLLTLFAFCSLFAVRAFAEETVYTVDCNGEGDFRTVQECLDALPSKPDGWRTVRILPGTYREKVTLDVYKNCVRIVGVGGAEEVRRSSPRRSARSFFIVSRLDSPSDSMLER